MSVYFQVIFGGAGRDRTDDLSSAIAVRYPLPVLTQLCVTLTFPFRNLGKWLTLHC